MQLFAARLASDAVWRLRLGRLVTQARAHEFLPGGAGHPGCLGVAVLHSLLLRVVCAVAWIKRGECRHRDDQRSNEMTTHGAFPRGVEDQPCDRKVHSFRLRKPAVGIAVDARFTPHDFPGFIRLKTTRNDMPLMTVSVL